MKHFEHEGYTFEISDYVPLGYQIWNIGAHNTKPGYVPICRLSSRQPYAGACNVDVDRLKAIKSSHYEIIMKAASCGVGGQTLRDMEAYINKAKGKKLPPYESSARDTIRKALPYVRELKWH